MLFTYAYEWCVSLECFFQLSNDLVMTEFESIIIIILL